MKEAQKYHVLPIDDRVIARVNPAIAGRPDVMGERKSLTLYEGMNGMLENTFINIKNQSVTIKAKLEIPEAGANGVILCQGGRFGGWSLYVKEGKPAYTYNFPRARTVHRCREKPIAEWFRFDRTRLRLRRWQRRTWQGGMAILSVNGKRGRKGSHQKDPAIVVLGR